MPSPVTSSASRNSRRLSPVHGFPPDYAPSHLRRSNSVPKPFWVSPIPILTNRRILKENRSSALVLRTFCLSQVQNPRSSPAPVPNGAHAPAPAPSGAQAPFQGNVAPSASCISPRTAPAPWGGERLLEQQEFEHRRCGGGGRRPGGVRRTERPELEKIEGLRVGVTDVSDRWRQGRGACPPSHLTVVELRSYRNVALPVGPFSHLWCSNSCRSGSRSPMAISPRSTTRDLGTLMSIQTVIPKHNAHPRSTKESHSSLEKPSSRPPPLPAKKSQSESRLIPLNSSATVLTSFTPNAVWTVASSRSRATSHI